jgi:catechol-2,3-dioxygenase
MAGRRLSSPRAVTTTTSVSIRGKAGAARRRLPAPRACHLAILYPTRAALADALKRLQAAEVELDGASDHGVSEALYLRDPDGNGLELYWDRPEGEWPRSPNGSLAMFTERLDLAALLREAP